MLNIQNSGTYYRTDTYKITSHLGVNYLYPKTSLTLQIKL